MEERIIFMSKVQFMSHHVQDMYVNAISKHFSVELWDLSKLYQIKEDTALAGVVVIKSLDDLDEKLKGLQKKCKVTVVTNIQPRDLTLIYQTLKANDIIIVGIVKDTIAISLEERGNKRFAKYFDIRNKILTYFPFLRKLVKRNRVKNSKYDYLLAGANYYPSYTNHFLRIHQIKYDEYLHAKKSSNIIGEKYILFLDSSPTTHPMYCNLTNSLNHSDYMRFMLTYLDKVEKDTGLKVVVSAHPKGHYDKEEWGGEKNLHWEYRGPNTS